MDNDEDLGMAVLQRYLPQTSDLDPLQVALAAQASAFSAVAPAGGNGHNLWPYCLAALLDQVGPLSCTLWQVHVVCAQNFARGQ